MNPEQPLSPAPETPKELLIPVLQEPEHHDLLPEHPVPVELPEHALEPQDGPTKALLDERPPLQSILIGLVLIGLSLGSVFAVAQTFVARAPEVRATQIATAEKSLDLSSFDRILLEAKSAYVLDITTGEVLFEKDAAAQLPLASITKVALALAVSEALDPQETVTISRRAVSQGGGGLTWGEMWKVSDLVDYMLIASSNTGAEALAEAADDELKVLYPEAPDGRAALWRMNNIAHQLGLEETYYLNPSGLDESGTQAGAMGSARNVARLFAHAIASGRELFVSTARPRMHLSALNISGRDVENTNNALDAIPNLIMGKTGYTDLAGGNLAVVYEPLPGKPIVVVVLGSTYNGRFDDIKSLVQATQKAVLPRD